MKEQDSGDKEALNRKSGTETISRSTSSEQTKSFKSLRSSQNNGPSFDENKLLLLAKS